MSFNQYITIYRLTKFYKYFFKKKPTKRKRKILVEYYQYAPSTIAFSYFANILSNKYNAEINAYTVNFYSFKQKIKFYIKQYLFNYKNLYKSFGCNKFVLPKIKNLSKTEKKEIIKIKLNIFSKKDVLNLKYKKIPIGYFIYDEYLRSFDKITININSEHFKDYLDNTLKLVFFWYKKLNHKIVKSVIISHSAYLMGLVGIIATHKGIPAYTVSLSSCQYLTKKYPRRFSDFLSYRKMIKKIDKNIKNPLINESETQIIKYFLNKDLKKIKVNKIKKRKKLTVLVASHCFTDAVHVFGIKNCFDDFYEWIDCLGKISNQTNYNWLIKLHPSNFDNNLIKINYFLEKYPKLKLLDKNIKNEYLLNKIDVVLTVYGTAGREFPMFKIPVINASTCGPHAAYNFNHNFEKVEEYCKVILNLERYIQNFQINKKEIFEFFYLRNNLDFSFLYNAKYINDIDENLRVKNLKPSSVSNIWLNDIDSSIKSNIYNDVKKFIDSKQHRFTANNNNEYSSFMPLKI